MVLKRARLVPQSGGSVPVILGGEGGGVQSYGNDGGLTPRSAITALPAYVLTSQLSVPEWVPGSLPWRCTLPVVFSVDTQLQTVVPRWRNILPL